jgi:hypothetical protein
MRAQIMRSNARYLMLTYYHPRKKRKNVYGMIESYFADITRRKSCSDYMGEQISCLYEIVR